MKRTFLYHKDYPKGRIFDDKVEYEDALASGAVGSPAAIDYSEKAPPKEDEAPKKRPGRKPKVKDGAE